jgi:hypothetical protein
MLTVLWIGGWASEFSVLSGKLKSLAPNAIWIALDPHAIAREPVELDNALASLQTLASPVLIAAWSLGALQLIRHMQVTGNELPCPALLIHPIDRLVGEHAPWPPRVLKRMRQRLREDPEETLADFWKLAHQTPNHGHKANLPAKTTPIAFDLWQKAALELGVEALDTGLADLQNGVKDRQADHPQGKSLWVLGNPDDAVCPFKIEAWKRLWPEAHARTVPSSHFFFQEPMDAIQEVFCDIEKTFEKNQ